MSAHPGVSTGLGLVDNLGDNLVLAPPARLRREAE